MKNYKIGVYAICKNEEKFIENWVASVSDADYIAVLDTGSTDHSMSMLDQLGVHTVSKIIDPFRFDTARNAALDMLPEDIDICISIDMDELLSPGWYRELSAQWKENVSSASCRFVWHFNEDGSEGGVFWPTRIHSRHHYTWSHAIHEVLIYTGPASPKNIILNNIQFNHHPDYAKPRAYLPLLENAVQEDPENARDLFYLGREYMYHHKWEKCIFTLDKYLKNPGSWLEERNAALRFMAKSYMALDKKNEAICCLLQAIHESPAVREAYIDLAYIYYYDSDWEKTAYYADAALKIKQPSHAFVNEGYAWDATPYDLGSIAHYHLNNFDLSLAYAYKCIELSPNEQRCLNNAVFIQDHIISKHLSL